MTTVGEGALEMRVVEDGLVPGADVPTRKRRQAGLPSLVPAFHAEPLRQLLESPK